ncbi:hypothetical protein FSP39_007139 [Pinctada imbricata]|uniref:Uncharacterized protein n=1 Tax=Pinctada imbricata TaxID=66713 RepID=A0AA88YKZ3_PINIB|nr:hypothetical protein FSP39_007139 [Pinctada imbricata]
MISGNLRQTFRLQVGDTAVFHCKPPVGKPEPKVLWRKGQEWIQGNSRVQVKDNGDLVISSVMVSDAGQYTCMAKNMAGEKASQPATLKVLEKPSFRKFPVDITTREAETVEFPCDVVGDQPLDVEWKKEGGFIAYGRMRTLRDHTLRIENVQASDAGVYICVAKNKVGTAEAVARLIVQFLPTFQVKPKDKVVGVGRTVTMQCSVMGIPPPTIIWSKQAREPTGEKTLMFPNFAEGRYSVASDGTLRIDRVQLADSGRYECEALSGLGSAKATAILEVKESDPRPPPVIRFGPQNQTLPTSDNCLLHCEAVGDPVPTIRWFKNGNPLPIDPRILQLGSGTLQISDVQKSDGGTYTCKASSETGETTRSAVLQVEDPLGNKPFRRSQNVKSFPGPPSKPIIDDIKNTDVTLSWQSSGNHGDSDVFAYIVEYFSHETTEGWIVASNSVSGSPYTVTNLQPSTAYVFLVRAKNSNGIGAPSELSDPVITADSTRIYKPDPQSVDTSTAKLSRQELRRRMRGIVVDLKAVDSLPSAANIIWRVYNDLDLIERFEIEYTEILDMSKSVLGHKRYQNASKDARSYTLKQLRSRQWYNICVRAYHGDLSTQCSTSFKVRPLDHVRVAPPRDFAVHKANEKSVRLEWLPPVDMGRGNGPIRGYHIKCVSTDDKHNCSRSVWGNVTMVTIHDLRPDLTYSLMVAARTNSGTGEWSKSVIFGPEQTSLMKEPWFIGVLIGVIAGTLWLALCIFSIWLCRKRRNKKKQKMQEMYSVPNFHTQKSDEGVRNSYAYYRNGYSQKDAQHGSSSMTPMAPEFANLLEPKDTDGHPHYHDGQSPYNDGQNLYNVPQLKTFYYSKDPVAPYATTTLINAGTLPGRSGSGQDMNHVFRPIPQNSGSGDSCCKHECSGDSNTDNSRPNTGIPPDHTDMMQSPTSDSGSHTTDENGFLLKKGKKPMKQVIQPKQAMVNLGRVPSPST